MKKRSEVFMLIDRASIRPDLKTALYKVAPQLQALSNASKERRMIIRNALNRYAAQYPQASHARTLVSTVLFVLKRIGPEPLYEFDIKDDHEVSDHAFCAAMRRMGYDVSSYKDKAKEEALQAGLMPVMSPGGDKILTFIPRPA